MFYPGLTEAGGLRSLYNREGTGTRSSSVLPRTSEQRLQLFLARLPRKLPVASSLSQGSVRQPGRFVYLWALQNSITSFWPLLPGAAQSLIQGGRFLQTFVFLLPPRTAPERDRDIPSLQEPQPLPQLQLPLLGELLSGGVEQMDQHHLTGFGQEQFSRVLLFCPCSLLAVVWGMRESSVTMKAWLLCWFFFVNRIQHHLYPVVITVILVVAVLFFSKLLFFHLDLLTFISPYWGKGKS